MPKWILTILLLPLLGCGGSFKKAVDEEVEPEVLSEPVVTADDETEYESETYDFYNETELSEDGYINARVVTFRNNSTLKLNEFKFDIIAESVNFLPGSKVITFKDDEYADCNTAGKPGGALSITSNEVQGNVKFDLAGQNAGINGYYWAKVKVYPDDVKNNNADFYSTKHCKVSYDYEPPKDVQSRIVPKSGGSGGRVFINSVNSDGFSYNHSDRLSLGSYRSIIDGKTKIGGWTHEVPEGSPGAKGEVCTVGQDGLLCD